MEQDKLEKIIKETLQTNTSPNRDSFTCLLSEMHNTPVTKNNNIRYTIQTVTSNIINNKLSDIITIWKSKRIILIPSLILLLFVGTFSLSPHKQKYDPEILKLAEQNETIEDPVVDDEEQIILTNFDSLDTNDIDIITNET